MNDLPSQVQNSLCELISNEERISQINFLLAVSGGMDSMVMAHVFLNLKLNFGIAHFNFKLREEASDLDEELIVQFCKNNEIPCHIKSEDTNRAAQKRNLSVQEVARELRYEFFDSVMSTENYHYVCTAHHGNDQLETFFIHLFRGSGLKGLCGIPEKRDRILRPMLWIPQSHLEHYAKSQAVPYREDITNQSDKYLRNRIRHHLVAPIIKWDEQHLSKSLHSISLLTDYQSYISQQLNIYINDYVVPLSPDIERINLTDSCIEDSSWLFMLKLYLLERGLFTDSIADFINSIGEWKTGARYKGKNSTAWYDRKSLWLIKDTFYNDWKSGDVIEVRDKNQTFLPGGDRIQIYADLETVKSHTWNIPVTKHEVTFPLILRHRQPGDYIELGTPPYYRKSLKKLLNDFRIPRVFKDRLYILTDAENRIIALPGLINSPKYTASKTSEIIIGYHSSLPFLFDLDDD